MRFFLILLAGAIFLADVFFVSGVNTVVFTGVFFSMLTFLAVYAPSHRSIYFAAGYGILLDLYLWQIPFGAMLLGVLGAQYGTRKLREFLHVQSRAGVAGFMALASLLQAWYMAFFVYIVSLAGPADLLIGAGFGMVWTFAAFSFIFVLFLSLARTAARALVHARGANNRYGSF